jgi:hypothetical protein
MPRVHNKTVTIDVRGSVFSAAETTGELGADEWSITYSTYTKKVIGGG